jgi:hypothetical protein
MKKGKAGGKKAGMEGRKKTLVLKNYKNLSY